MPVGRCCGWLCVDIISTSAHCGQSCLTPYWGEDAPRRAFHGVAGDWREQAGKSLPMGRLNLDGVIAATPSLGKHHLLRVAEVHP